MTCETNATKLLEAALAKNDQRILLQIEGLDPVCIEVRYHASCYKRYTKCVYEGKPTSGRFLSESFDCFCDEVIKKRIIDGGEILKMKSLNRSFKNIVSKTESLDISTYRNSQLKARMQNKYPELQYIQPKSTSCEFVFCPTDEDKLIPLNLQDSESESEQSSTTTDDDQDIEAPSPLSPIRHEAIAQIYRSALILKTALSSASSVKSWPPTASSLECTVHCTTPTIQLYCMVYRSAQ